MPQITVVDCTTKQVTERAMTAPEVTAFNALQTAAGLVATATLDRKTEQLAASDDLTAQYVAGMAILDDIITNGPTHTAAQVRDDVVKLAVIMKRTARLLKATLV